MLLLLKSLRRSVSQILRPKKIKAVRVNDKLIDEKILAIGVELFAATVLDIMGDKK